MFKSLFSFKGRIRRLEYALTHIGVVLYIISIGFTIGLMIGLKVMPDLDIYQIKVMYYLACIPAFYVVIAQSVKRCHDRGNSGWWILIPFYSIILQFAAGDPHENEYGENPKTPGALEDSFDPVIAETYYQDRRKEPRPIDDVDEDGFIKQ